MKIGIIGAGNIGATLARKLANSKGRQSIQSLASSSLNSSIIQSAKSGGLR